MSATKLAKAALKIPLRIERGPTDILKALAGTVNHIPGAPDTCIIDDPFTLPKGHYDKKEYKISRLSGIKTARFLLNKHPELFYRDDAEPKIAAFLPDERFSPEMQFTEDDILWCVEHNDVTNGIMAYKALIESKAQLSEETLLKFFEMLCYTNEEDLQDSASKAQCQEASIYQEPLEKVTWKTKGLTTKMFNSLKLEMDPPRIYSAMICGLSKYNEHDKAMVFFEEFKENFPSKGLYLNAYEYLIRSAIRVHSSLSGVEEAIGRIVSHMEENLVRPDLGVFNAILSCYTLYQVDEQICLKCLRLVNDMRALGIEPSLATYSDLITVMMKVRSFRNNLKLVSDLLRTIANSPTTLTVRDHKDARFLDTAMRLIAFKTNNLVYAKTLHKIYMKCPSMFTSNANQARYLDDLFKVIITTDTLSNILEFYDTYVPFVFQPRADTFEALGEALDLYQAPMEVIERIAKDIITTRAYKHIKNDAIFRRDPAYVEALEKATK